MVEGYNYENLIFSHSFRGGDEVKEISLRVYSLIKSKIHREKKTDAIFKGYLWQTFR